MQELETERKIQVAQQLRVFAESHDTEYAAAAIEGLGELGGSEAIKQLEEVMEKESGKSGPGAKALWAALLRAYGRAGRFLPD